MQYLTKILTQKELSKADIEYLLSLRGDEQKLLFQASEKIKAETVGRKTYFRGLIEFSNVCHKNCLYCGIRGGNKKVNRYFLHQESVMEAVSFAWKNKYASIVLQSGEREDEEFVNYLHKLLLKIKQLTNGKMGITLSVGEQKPEVYQKWFDLGANRYLLRIEASNRDLYEKWHPHNNAHRFERRMACLESLKEIGYQVGTGVMIGAPFQTISHLADDLLFFKQFDVDMIGMGPYIEHHDTPMMQFTAGLPPLTERFQTSLNMIAVLRLMMPDINIAASTAMQAIDPMGREKAIKIGANVIMPNITPAVNRKDYLLYENKPCTDEGAEECLGCLEARIDMVGDEIAWDETGDSFHYRKKKHL